MIPSMGGVIDDTLFESDVKVLFHIPKEDLGKLNKALADATSGEVSAAAEEEKFFKKPARK